MAFCCPDPEHAQQQRFAEMYGHARSPVMQTIERAVCGCDYGGSSWTSRAQADALIGQLRLTPATDWVDLGAGTGWPALYVAKTVGCRVTLVDLPEIGLQIAQERAGLDGLTGRVTSLVADAADLPFADSSFDAVSHSDLLCCLTRKRTVLEQCARILRPDGRMAFTVISIAPGLDPSETERALANAPEFVETEQDYQTLLSATGWIIEDVIDLTDAYRDCCQLQIEADTDSMDGLSALLGSEAATTRLANWQSKLAAIDDGLFLRQQFVCAMEHGSEQRGRR